MVGDHVDHGGGLVEAVVASPQRKHINVVDVGVRFFGFRVSVLENVEGEEEAPVLVKVEQGLSLDYGHPCLGDFVEDGFKVLFGGPSFFATANEEPRTGGGSAVRAGHGDVTRFGGDAPGGNGNNCVMNFVAECRHERFQGARGWMPHGEKSGQQLRRSAFGETAVASPRPCEMV